jgi:hypothetical protein
MFNFVAEQLCLLLSLFVSDFDCCATLHKWAFELTWKGSHVMRDKGQAWRWIRGQERNQLGWESDAKSA